MVSLSFWFSFLSYVGFSDDDDPLTEFPQLKSSQSWKFSESEKLITDLCPLVIII